MTRTDPWRLWPLLLTLLILPGESLALEKSPFQVQSGSVVLGDLDSGMILFARRDEQQLQPASLSKVMTLYLIFEALQAGKIDLDTRMLVSQKAWKTGGTKTFVKAGDQVKVEEMIRGIGIQSGNDACVVMAEHLLGTEKTFVEHMNAKALALEMKHTRFTNATGLPDPAHLTTARDLFALTVAITRQFPEYMDYFKEKIFTFSNIKQYNKNKLLWRDPVITGMKTGYTNQAGYNVIATSNNEGQKLAVVILGAHTKKSSEDDALHLIKQAHARYETVKFFAAGETVSRLRVWQGKVSEVQGVLQAPLAVTLLRTARKSLELGILHNPLIAPIAKGQRIGTVVAKVEGRDLFELPLLAGHAVERGEPWRVTLDSLRLFFAK